MCQKLLLLPQSKTSKQTFWEFISEMAHSQPLDGGLCHLFWDKWKADGFQSEELLSNSNSKQSREIPDPRLSFCAGQFVKCSALEILMPDADMPPCVCYTDGFAMSIRLNLKIFLSQLKDRGLKNVCLSSQMAICFSLSLDPFRFPWAVSHINPTHEKSLGDFQITGHLW